MPNELITSKWDGGGVIGAPAWGNARLRRRFKIVSADVRPFEREEEIMIAV